MALRTATLACLVHFGFSVRIDSQEDSLAEISANSDTQEGETWGVADLADLGNSEACETSWCRLTAHIARFSIQRWNLERAARSWEAPPVPDLNKPLLAAKLCQATYEDRATVEQVVAAEGMQLLDHTDRMFFASKPDGEVFVVFRGTADLHDVLVDLFVVPTDHNGAKYHSGFLHFIQRPNVQAALRQYARGPRVTVIGHSLGGAYAYALAASGLMPAGGRIEEVITFGAPAVIYGESRSLVNRNFKHTAFANQADPVPRLLGSDPQVLGDVLGLYQGMGSGVDTPDRRLLDAVSAYEQQGDAVWLKGETGRPHVVPPTWRAPVMALQMIMSIAQPPTDALANHLMAGYRSGIEEEIASGGSPAPAPTWWR